MSYKKITFKDFIFDGIHKKYLCTDNDLQTISNKLCSYGYDKSFVIVPLHYKFNEFIHIIKNKLALKSFIDVNGIYINNKKVKNLTNIPIGLEYIEHDGGLIDREKDVNLLEIILNKKIRSNIILVGEAGVGKTKIVSNLNENILRLNLATLVSGTAYRGSFENKLNDIIKFAIDNKVTIFIDEIHSLYNLGLSEGGISAMDILKPYLSLGNLSIIGATTTKELKIINNDDAFKRRFTTIYINPISIDKIKLNMNKLLKNMDVSISSKISVNILNKAYKLFGKYRLLDGFLDMLDTINSYCLINGFDIVNDKVLKDLDALWDKIY